MYHWQYSPDWGEWADKEGITKEHGIDQGSMHPEQKLGVAGIIGGSFGKSSASIGKVP